MKKCPWCGKEYPDAATHCAVDREPLDPPAPDPVQVETPWRPQLIDLGTVSGSFTYEEGFSRPNWTTIGAAIKGTIVREAVPAAWTEAAIQWGYEVRSNLGGDYDLRWSEEFILLSALERTAADRLLAFSGRTLQHIRAVLKEAEWKSASGKHLILLFADIDDYYQYVSYFYEEGVHPASGGCLIHKDYVHIALPYLDGRNVRTTLVHELAHNSVAHLPLPLWVNEGLAIVLHRRALNSQIPILDGELRDRHLGFWNAENIQKFWSGVSFDEPGDSNELSYSLAEILLKLLVEESESLADFLKHASREDAGQTAALDCFGTDLGTIASTFLGEGDWRPNRKAIVGCWNEVSKLSEPTQTDSPAENQNQISP